MVCRRWQNRGDSMETTAGTNILGQIRLGYNLLTKTERKIADYVLANPQQVLFMSITELAEGCGVAEASVHRFCRQLGVKGYQEFKMRLSISLNMEQERHPEHAEDTSDLLARIEQSHLDAIRETTELLDENAVRRVVTMMNRADRIWFYGVGNSMITAMEAVGRFLHITPKVAILEDGHLQAMAASMAGPKDLYFLLSYSGETRDTVHVASLAHERKAMTVAITRYPKSELSKLVDEVLLYGGNEGPLQGGSMGVKISQLHVIEVLFQYYYEANREASIDNTHATAQATVGNYY